MKTISRRQALGTLGAIGAGTLGAVLAPKSAKANSMCLAPPDCSRICEHGGTPKGGGTQECVCADDPTRQFAEVCYTGNYGDVRNLPKRAASNSDGGPALNSKKWQGYTVRLTQTTGSDSSRIPVKTGDNMDYVSKPELGGPPTLGATTFKVSKVGYTVSATRDAYGRVNGLSGSFNSGAVNCINCANCRNCNCCNCTDCTNCTCNCSSNCSSNCDCGDDGYCFVRATLLTADGFKDVHEIQPGDILRGPDGDHKVVGITHGTVDTRDVVSPASDPDTVLTGDHVIKGKKGKPVTFDTMYYWRLEAVFSADTNPKIKGSYYYEGLENELKESKTEFKLLGKFPRDTMTTTLIVESGLWGLTRKLVPVLLARKEVRKNGR